MKLTFLGTRAAIEARTDRHEDVEGEVGDMPRT